MATEQKILSIRLELNKLSEFVSTREQHRYSASVEFHQLTWNIKAVLLLDSLYCYVQCNGNGSTPADWSCSANVICHMSVKPFTWQIAKAGKDHTFNASNSECGLYLNIISDPAMRLVNELNGTVIVEALIIPKVVPEAHDLLRQDESMDLIVAQVQKIQESLRNSADVAPKFGHVETPFNKGWNYADTEGHLEFGENGLVVVKGSDYGLVRALEPLQNKKSGYVYYELKIVNIPENCPVHLGVSQKTTTSTTFRVFEYAFAINDASTSDVFGCGVKFSSGTIFFMINGRPKFWSDLNSKKLGKGVDMALAIKLCGDGCSVQLGQIEMSDDEGECPF